MVDAQRKRIGSLLHIGTMGWSYGFWKGAFYPENLDSKEFLAYYASRFNSVEVNSTFYRIPRVETVLEWKRQVPEGFTFSLKFPAKITHVKMLRDCQDETEGFIERVSLLKEKLGALLLQFPSNFSLQHLPLLRDYLKTLPKERRYAVEVRNKALLNPELYIVLREYGVALSWVESASMPLVDETTSDFIYVRWEGDRKKTVGTLGKPEQDKSEAILTWAQRLKPSLERGSDIFGYFSKYFSGFPPSDVTEFLKQF